MVIGIVDGDEVRALLICNVFWSNPLSREKSRWHIVTFARWEGLGAMPIAMSLAVAEHRGGGNGVYGWHHFDSSVVRTMREYVLGTCSGCAR